MIEELHTFTKKNYGQDLTNLTRGSTAAILLSPLWEAMVCGLHDRTWQLCTGCSIYYYKTNLLLRMLSFYWILGYFIVRFKSVMFFFNIYIFITRSPMVYIY